MNRYFKFTELYSNYTASSPDETDTITLLDFLKYDMKSKIILNVMLPPLSALCHVKTFKVCKSSPVSKFSLQITYVVNSDVHYLKNIFTSFGPYFYV